MEKCIVCVFVLAIILEANAAIAKEKCMKCVEIENCQAYGNLNRKEQQKWQERFICDPAIKNPSPVFGFSGNAKGDLVCCPDNILGVEISFESKQKENYETLNDDQPGVSKRNSFGYSQNGPYANSNYNNYPTTSAGQNRDDWGSSYSNSHEYDDYSDSDVDGHRSPYWGNRRNKPKRPNANQNPYFLPAERTWNRNIFNRANIGGQCPESSFPPNPDMGCCGLEASQENNINVPSYQQQNPEYPNSWMPQVSQPSQGGWPSWMDYGRKKRDTEANVTVGNRIAGGKETDLAQFPWTVLLKTTFTYPTKDVAFSCGGSLISSRYVLTAGHCVYDQQGTIKFIEVNLAEYDKRTFPRDCKIILSRGETCIDNIVMHAEDAIIHPEYDDNRLHNDIALIRLQGNAPYTDYIRPICLPPINVDSPDFSNLRLAVAGWGRNGQYKSNIKQSTIVNLVPQRECKKSYPGLTRQQVCAAGYTGEDTCKGDSGGPLMMLYGGKYYVSGVVSGKRADAPCGTSVPSLYTNVYQYVPWIQSIIKN